MTTPHDDLPVEYVRAGLALIPIPRGMKGPRNPGWQLEENAVRTEEQAVLLDGGNIGLAHRWCGTCAVDLVRRLPASSAVVCSVTGLIFKFYY